MAKTTPPAKYDQITSLGIARSTMPAAEFKKSPLISIPPTPVQSCPQPKYVPSILRRSLSRAQFSWSFRTPPVFCTQEVRLPGICLVLDPEDTFRRQPQVLLAKFKYGFDGCFYFHRLAV